jgi:hypothetical protein
LSLQGVVYLIHDGVRLDHIGGHGRAHTNPCELGVYDSDEVAYLSCALGSCVSCSNGGYVMASTSFYERGFSVPSHQFLHSLLQFYGL